jgi:hypothetical protein
MDSGRQTQQLGNLDPAHFAPIVKSSIIALAAS